MFNCSVIFYGVARNMVSSKNFIQKSNYFKENKIIATKCCKIVLLVERAKKTFFSQWHSRLKLVASRGKLLHVHLARAVY